jgi:hypothetical protein
MLYKRTLQRKTDSELCNRTITIEEYIPPWKYMVLVYTAKSQTTPPQPPSFGAGPEIDRYPFNDQHQAIQCAQQKLADSIANGYVDLV